MYLYVSQSVSQSIYTQIYLQSTHLEGPKYGSLGIWDSPCWLWGTPLKERLSWACLRHLLQSPGSFLSLPPAAERFCWLGTCQAVQGSPRYDIQIYIYIYGIIYVYVYIIIKKNNSNNNNKKKNNNNNNKNKNNNKKIKKNNNNRRNFRSRTSDSMDEGQAGVERVREEKGREEKRRKEKIKEKKIRRKKMQVHEKVEKSQNNQFFQWFVAQEGRKVGQMRN